MRLGSVVIDGYDYPITRLRLRDGKLLITAVHHGPVPPCAGKPATVFGEDGTGICQSWVVDLPAGITGTVTVELPLQIVTAEVVP
jgi:hypothetical protein